MESLVTIAIPTFNRLHYLKEAVGSALKQTHRNIEIVIGDDGTNDELRRWSEDQAAVVPAIRYQKNERNLGLAGNWNALVDAARGEFIVIIGDDDRLLPEFVHETLTAALPDGDVAFSDHFVIDAEGQRLDDEANAFAKKYGRDQLSSGLLSDPEYWAWRNAIPISAALMRTMTLRKLRFKEDLNNPEVELFIRWAGSGGKFHYLASRLVEYRVHAQSETTAGLRADRLARYLMDLPAPAHLESVKARLLGELIVNAVSQSLLAGDVATARIFLESPYYAAQRHGSLARFIQNVCAKLPPWLAGRAYRTIWRLKRAYR